MDRMREAKSSSEKYFNQSIVKAVAVLDLFTTEHYELGISTIAAHLDMPVSTAHRILTTLESVGYISQNPENGKYRLGLGCFILGNKVRFYNELANVSKHYFEFQGLSRPQIACVQAGQTKGNIA